MTVVKRSTRQDVFEASSGRVWVFVGTGLAFRSDGLGLSSGRVGVVVRTGWGFVRTGWGFVIT